MREHKDGCPNQWHDGYCEDQPGYVAPHDLLLDQLQQMCDDSNSAQYGTLSTRVVSAYVEKLGAAHQAEVDRLLAKVVHLEAEVRYLTGETDE